jgi:membrane protease YdiL (CAAX protease family)
MNRIKRLATESPIIFGLGVTFISIILVIISSVLGAVWPGEPYGQYIGGTIGRLASIAILLAALARLGWLRQAGVTRPGRGPTWLISLLLLAYVIAVSTYAMRGNFDFSFSDPALLSLVTLFLLTHAFLEEVVFRGLVMVAFVRVWGSTTPGLVKSVLVSSLVFAGMHIVNVLSGNPLPIVLLQSVGAFFLGILFAALVLSGKSIYPATFLHGLANLAGYLLLSANPSAGTAPSAWLLQSTLLFPLAILGVYILRGISPSPVIPDTA